MTDRDKKMAEIREALVKATPGELIQFDTDHISLVHKDIIGSKKIARTYDDSYTPIFANSPEWLRFLLDELDRLQEELKDTCAAADLMSSEIVKLRKDGDKLIEGLQWYAGHRFDDGDRARRILAECGIQEGDEQKS